MWISLYYVKTVHCQHNLALHLQVQKYLKVFHLVLYNKIFEEPSVYQVQIQTKTLHYGPLKESHFQHNASTGILMNYCPDNDRGSNSAAAAALNLFRPVIKSWISYGAPSEPRPSLPWYPSCSLYIIALCIEHSFYQASIHNLISNLPQATLNWMAHFKIMFHHTINNGEYLPEKLEKPLCWKWPLTPVMTCLI